MINYFWTGLLVSAVFFAVYLDMTGQKPYEQPDPVLLQDFSTDQHDWKVLTVAGDSSGRMVVAPPDGPDVTGGIGRLEYQLESVSEVLLETKDFIDVTMVTDDLSRQNRLTPEGLALRIRADGFGHRLDLEFLDAEGDLFIGRLPRKLDWSDRWETVKFSFSDLTPGSENPAARPNFPLLLDRLVLIPSRSAERHQGVIEFDTVQVLYPELVFTHQELRSETWMGVVTQSAARWAELAISLAFQLIGIMMLWLGLMRIAEKAGLVQFLASLFKPVMCRLFPDIPPDGEAMGAILMNIAANMLGLGNAATPIGLKAMEEMQKLNPNKDTASNSMCMFLAMNTSNVQLIPATIIGYRVAAGSTNIMQFWPLMVMATFVSTVVAVLACKFFEKLPMFRIPQPPADEPTLEEKEERS